LGLRSIHVTAFVRLDQVLLNFPAPGALAGVIDNWNVSPVKAVGIVPCFVPC